MSRQNRFKIEQNCRICGNNLLQKILFLGHQPLANALIEKDRHADSYATYPLTLVRCQDCGLVQILETIPPDVLFTKYLYFSSYADTLVANARHLAKRVIQRYHVRHDNLVVELGSNDGYLLQFYKSAGVKVLGVEPAANVATVALRERRIPTLVTFFSKEVARQISEEYGLARVIHANNVLAHVADLHDFVDGIQHLLAPSGLAIIEVAYVKDMMDACAFDLIYHEHLCYYSLTTLERLFRMHGLVVFDIEHIPAHGGSLRVWCAHPGIFEESASIGSFRCMERSAGLDEPEFYKDFAKKVNGIKQNICNTLKEFKRRGDRIAAYGAAAKATVLLNYFNIGTELIDYIVDRNPEKQGKIVPGPNLFIFPVEKILKDNPDVIFITAWNYAEEIMGQLRNKLGYHGKYIIPLPSFRVID